jgi:hypothetical protein
VVDKIKNPLIYLEKWSIYFDFRQKSIILHLYAPMWAAISSVMNTFFTSSYKKAPFLETIMKNYKHEELMVDG